MQLTNPEAWLEVLGRSHVVLVHFPVGLLIIAAIVEICGALFSRRRVVEGTDLPLRPSGTVVTMLAFGAVAAAIAAVSGWMYADGDWRDGSFDTLWWHRWVGVAAASVAIVALLGAVIARSSSGGKSIGVFRLMLVLGAVLVGLAGHYGGSMVHGENHLFAPLFKNDAPATPTGTDPNPTELVAGDTSQIPSTTDPTTNTNDAVPNAAPRIEFASQVLPIFESECFQCHGPRRQRGSLRLDMPDLLAERISAGDLIVAGDPAASELVRRVSLPADDFDHMPPGDESLTSEQIAIISDWITQGASVVAIATTDTSTNAAPPAGGQNAVATNVAGDDEHSDAGSNDATTSSQRVATDPLPTLTAEQRPARDAAIARIVERGASARVIAANTDAVEADLSGLGEDFAAADLALLTGLESSLVWLDCSNTALNDTAVAALAPFTQLRRLNLTDTKVTDAALEHIAELPRLEVLNLNGTAVTDGGLLTLRPLTHLQRLYLWRSHVTLTGAASLRATNPNIETVLGD